MNFSQAIQQGIQYSHWNDRHGRRIEYAGGIVFNLGRLAPPLARLPPTTIVVGLVTVRIPRIEDALNQPLRIINLVEVLIVILRRAEEEAALRGQLLIAEVGQFRRRLEPLLIVSVFVRL